MAEEVLQARDGEVVSEMKYLRYLWYVIRHKWYVGQACRRQEGFVFSGIFHDWSKILPSEFFPYAKHFYGNQAKEWRDDTGYYKPTDTGDPDFDFAWLLHQKRNKHHWQWWILPEDNGGTKVLEMDEPYIIEMYCDWVGASLAQGHGGYEGVIKWYEVNGEKMSLATKTRIRIEQLVYNGENK